jgi:hypothetical protein
MTREEKSKAIGALKISAPIMAVTQEEFKDYIQTLNKVMDWLEQEPFINKSRVSSGVCEHDKNVVFDKIRAEIAELHLIGYATVDGKREIASRAVIQIIDKYKAESEG